MDADGGNVTKGERQNRCLIYARLNQGPIFRAVYGGLGQSLAGGIARGLSPVGYGGLVENAADVTAHGPRADD